MLTLNSSWMGLSFMWNSLHVILLPAVLLRFVEDTHKNSVLGLLTGVGLILAMVVQPIAGAWSDRWRSRWGRRRPLIVLGTSLDVIFLAFMAFAGGLPLLAVGYIGLQLASNMAHGSMQGLLPDIVSKHQLGKGSAIKSVLDMLGLVVASLWMGSLVSPENASIGGPIGVVIAVLIVTTGITVLTTHEDASIPHEQYPPLAQPKQSWNFRAIFQDKPFIGLIASRLVFLLGVYGIQAFAQYYVRDTLTTTNPVKLTGDLMAAIAVALVAFAMAGGTLCDRWGNKPVHAAAAFLVAGGSILFWMASTPTAVLVSGSIIGAGIGLFLTANWALAAMLAPPDQSGKYLGLTNLATAGAGALSRIFGPVIDGINNSSPGSYEGYTVLFAASAIFAIAGWLILTRTVHSPSLQRTEETTHVKINA